MLKAKESHTVPLFTSCCPGWVRFLKTQYPDMVGQLSTAKSPQQMFGAVAKSYYAELLGVEAEKAGYSSFYRNPIHIKIRFPPIRSAAYRREGFRW